MDGAPADHVATDGTVQIGVDVVNVGRRAGDEVVQFYTRTDGAGVTRPVQELRGFKRVHLEAGARTRVTFTVAVEQLAYYDAAMQLAVEPATVQVRVGNSAQHLPTRGSFTLTGPKRLLRQRSAFFCDVDVA